MKKLAKKVGEKEVLSMQLEAMDSLWTAMYHAQGYWGISCNVVAVRTMERAYEQLRKNALKIVTRENAKAGLMQTPVDVDLSAYDEADDTANDEIA